MINIGTIGKKPCEIVLNKILIECNDKKLTNQVMVRFARLKKAIKQFKYMPDKEFANGMLSNYFGLFKQQVPNWPQNVKTHALCCYTAHYREALRNEG